MEFALQSELLGNSVAVWLRAVGMFVLVAGSLLLVKRMLVKRIALLAKHTATDVDDLIVDLLGRTRTLVILAIGLGAGSTLIQKPDNAQKVVEVVLIIALFFQMVIWSNGLINYGVARITNRAGADSQGDAAIIRVLGTAARFVVFTLLFLLALDRIVSVGPLLTGLGIGGIAIALAVQNILSDLFGAVSILVDKPFMVGDFVVVDDLKGTVEHIGMKTTRIRSLGGEQIIFSNNDLLQSRVRNFKRMMERRIAFTTGVTYQTSHAQLAEIPQMIRQIVESREHVRFERCHFLKYADSWLEYETIYWVLSPEYMIYADTQQAINLELFSKFEAEGIEFAYPTRTVFVEGGAEKPAAGVL